MDFPLFLFSTRLRTNEANEKINKENGAILLKAAKRRVNGGGALSLGLDAYGRFVVEKGEAEERGESAAHGKVGDVVGRHSPGVLRGFRTAEPLDGLLLTRVASDVAAPENAAAHTRRALVPREQAPGTVNDASWSGGRATGARAGDEQATAERTIDERALPGERATGECVTGERAIGERTTGERATGEPATGTRADAARAVAASLARERVPGEQATRERATGERVTGSRADDAFSAGERATREQAATGWAIGDKATGQQASESTDWRATYVERRSSGPSRFHRGLTENTLSSYGATREDVKRPVYGSPRKASPRRKLGRTPVRPVNSAGLLRSRPANGVDAPSWRAAETCRVPRYDQSSYRPGVLASPVRAIGANDKSPRSQSFNREAVAVGARSLSHEAPRIESPMLETCSFEAC
ncbi:hypothetical protein KFL_012290010 [Klebsormidium nitens]|uniref:Uncharacterized protein n=1 Tax=Klebsormidium nitens TaxID=105231 RepID=A0A1Y1ITS9_KLENI|nr:hypothetical protein KFL_012290010 [Klebsormidium nitens]|eukprot:GAQ92969.1 hypothetical protein KFL_012290010 [Klebsormidium nitens]